MEQLFKEIRTKIAEKSPLVHNLTNHVVMNHCANVLLAAGASPVMTVSEKEAKDMARIASSLAVNMGTPDDQWEISLAEALEGAAGTEAPVVFDPVGAGATGYRAELARRIAAHKKITIIRGNVSELLFLAAEGAAPPKGVDASGSLTEEAKALIKAKAAESGKVWSVSGPVDYITDGKREILFKTDIPVMAKITGMGCASTSMTAAAAAVHNDPFEAAAAALWIFLESGLRAQKTHNSLKGKEDSRPVVLPGSFLPAFIDALADGGTAAKETKPQEVSFEIL